MTKHLVGLINYEPPWSLDEIKRKLAKDVRVTSKVIFEDRYKRGKVKTRGCCLNVAIEGVLDCAFFFGQPQQE